MIHCSGLQQTLNVAAHVPADCLPRYRFLSIALFLSNRYFVLTLNPLRSVPQMNFVMQTAMHVLQCQLKLSVPLLLLNQ